MDLTTRATRTCHRHQFLSPMSSPCGAGARNIFELNPAESEESSQARRSRELETSAGGAEADGLRQAPELLDHLRGQLPADVCYHVPEVSAS